MALSINKMTLCGQVGKYINLRANDRLCAFQIKVTKAIKDKDSGQWSYPSTYINVVVWGDQAKNLHAKMQQHDWVAVDGEFEINEYTDNDGVTHKTPQCNARQVVNITSRERDFSQRQGGGGQSAPPPQSNLPDDDDTPF